MRRSLLVLFLFAVVAVLAIVAWPSLFPPAKGPAGEHNDAAAAQPAAGTTPTTAVAPAAAPGGVREAAPTPGEPQPLLRVRGLVLADPRHADLSGLKVLAYAGTATDTSSLFMSGMDRSAPPAFVLIGGPVADAPVDAGGNFELTTSTRDLRLTIDDDHYLLAMPEIVHVLAATGTAEVVLAPTLGACVKGRLFGERASAIADVRLHLEPDPMTAVSNMQAYMGAVLAGTREPQHPDREGAFVFRGVVPGAVATLAATGDRAFATQQIAPLVAGETRDVALAVRAAGSLRVKVVDEQDKPVAGSDVRVRTAEASQSMMSMLRSHHATTDAAGTCTLHDLEPTTLQVEASARDRVAAEATVDLHSTTEAAEVKLTLTEGGTVLGIVTDPTGAPLADARVAHQPMTNVPLLGDMSTQLGASVLAQIAEGGVRTDAEGRFRLTGLADPGEFCVVAAHPSFGASVARGVHMGDEDVAIRLTTLGKVFGSVTAGGSEPVSEFTVRVVRTMFLVMKTPVRTEVVHAADGAFALVGIPPGDYSLEIAAEGMSTSQTNLRVADGDVDVGTITLQRGASIAGRVLADDGSPVRGALVRRRQGAMADNPMLAMFNGGSASVRTGADGAFRLGPLPPGKLQLLASAAGFASGRSERVELAPGQDLEGLVITLGHGGSIALRLHCGPGQHASEFLLMAQEQSTQVTASPEPAEDGTYRFSNLDPGQYVVQAMPGGLMRGFGAQQWRPGRGMDLGNLFQKLADGVVSQRCTVRAGEETAVALDLADLTTGARWTLRVEVGTQPLENGIVEATALSGSRMRAGFLVGGRVTFGNVEPGDYTLRVRSGLTLAPVGSPQTLAFPAGQSEHESTIRLPAGELRGRVVDARTGKPLPQALVRLIHDEAAGRDDPVGLALADADGNFTFAGLADGTYGVLSVDALSERDEAAAQRGIRIEAGRATSEVVLRTRPAATASVRVTDQNGAPLAGATVLCVDRDGHPLGVLGLAVTDGSGKAWFGGLPAGAARAVGRAPGLAPAVGEVQDLSADRPVEFALALAPGTRTTVTTVDRDGKPLLGATLSARCDGGPWLPAMLLVEQQQNGSFDLGPLGRGAWEFRCEHPAVGTLVQARTLAGESAVTVVIAPK
ncbi:MAG: carboxypeptidase-like regulatory domain-containing protein [Planctomycetota bacterium]